uniref:Uncharacterized protein n=1 Tax=Phaeomonas parva TaxID=124430 RepID=A0A7S1TPZ8_9STRA|mmetsp:Transcript_123/g.434  ORF Transcript_123/g.434 Transcript_123/m.434 type:complete len:218 (+) Transcript_123:196-849(+)|eukprot:CAMPEP_0118871488 /NCGR_PEP_ID=MMETSP1163-20130328/14051_1 /TAXON_ID=124430 /ORGANISM="Phaeomonas parva, Strain CCMP2877" /LENGTH=217 /DNA_ID=CAMNT_0006806587 /DNA_START=171 /DNA_END=824 /DNA_ORIENTATION=+
MAMEVAAPLPAETVDGMVALVAKGAYEDALGALCENLEVPDYASNVASRFRLDFLFSCFVLATENPGIQGGKLGVFLRICQDTYDRLRASEDGQIDGAYDYFREQLVKAAVDGQGDAGQFTLPEVKVLARFVTHSLFRFHKAYQLATSAEFEADAGEVRKTTKLAVDFPLMPSSLNGFQGGGGALIEMQEEEVADEGEPLEGEEGEEGEDPAEGEGN